jgi:hypothetical protein
LVGVVWWVVGVAEVLVAGLAVGVGDMGMIAGAVAAHK